MRASDIRIAWIGDVNQQAMETALGPLLGDKDMLLPVRADGQQLVNQAMGGILQDSINEMGAKAVLKGGGNPLQGILGSLGGLQTAIQDEWKNQEADFQQFGKDVCSRVVSLEESRKALVGSLK